MQKRIRTTVIAGFVGVVFTLLPVSAPAQQWHSVTGGAELVDAGNRVVEGRIDLAWVAAIDDVGVTGYEVERCAAAGCTDFVRIGTPDR